MTRGGSDPRALFGSRLDGALPLVPRRHGPVRDEPSLLEAGDVERLLLKMQEQFRWPNLVGGFSVVSVTPIRGGALYRCRPRGEFDQDLALKVKPRWSPGRARRLYEAMNRVARAWVQLDGVSVVPALGWALDPPSLCMPFVDGSDLRSLLRSSPELDDRVLSAVRRSGLAIGRFHSMYSVNGKRSPASREHMNDLEHVARRMLVARSAASIAWDALPAAACYEDFSPANVRVDRQGVLHLLDPPVQMRVTPVHRDLAVFLLSVRRIVKWAGAVWGSGSAEGLLETLEGTFYEGYASSGPVDVRNPTDLWLIRLYEGDRMLVATYNLLRKGRYVWGARGGAQWAGTVVRLRRAARLISEVTEAG